MTLSQLASIAELPARALVLAERLLGAPTSSVPELDEVVRRAFSGSGPDRDVLVSLARLRVTRDDLPIAALAAFAAEHGLAAASLVLSSDSAVRRLPPHAHLAEPLAPATALTSLPWKNRPRELSRVSLRVRTEHVRERLLRDPRPEVVAALLAFDTTRLDDVLRVASRRPSSAMLGRAVVASRWLGLLPVREALVANPFTEAWLALVLLPTVRRTTETPLWGRARGLLT